MMNVFLYEYIIMGPYNITSEQSPNNTWFV